MHSCFHPQIIKNTTQEQILGQTEKKQPSWDTSLIIRSQDEWHQAQGSRSMITILHYEEDSKIFIHDKKYSLKTRQNLAH